MTATKTVADSALVSLAAALAEAELAAEKATTSHREAEAARDVVLDRIRGKDAARAEIVARRAAGDERPDDGAELALIAADQEVLAGLLAHRDAAVAAARAEVEKANRVLDQARHDLAREEAVRTAAALVPRIEELAGLLLEAIRQSNATDARLDRGQTSWRPSADLMAALVPLEQAAWAERHR